LFIRITRPSKEERFGDLRRDRAGKLSNTKKENAMPRVRVGKRNQQRIQEYAFSKGLRVDRAVDEIISDWFETLGVAEMEIQAEQEIAQTLDCLPYVPNNSLIN
jgi:hypothetical protein